MKPLKESEIQAQVKEYLQLQGWYVMRHQQGLGALRGLSDLTAIKDGLTIYLEIKTLKGNLSKYQEAFRDEIISHGGTYLVIRDLSEIIEYLKVI